MSEKQSRFVVLAAIDDSAMADPTGAAAARYANAARGAELHFVYVVPWAPEAPTAAERAAALDASGLIEGGRQRLEAVAQHVGYDSRIVCHVALGDPAREILQLAARIEADLVITGTHGRRGFARAMLGSVAEHVVRGASCPVLVFRAKDYHRTLAPEIDPPCPDCLQVQSATGGTEMWCARHAETHPRAKTRYELPEPFAVGSMLVRP
ncbi:MAG TPA: universal stress protein [Polyangiaceae bacterium]|jgi:nucleotide-binding universal stress UspA family protein